MRKRVAVLGAGVAGLTAAHELAERDFDVFVFENRPDAGGKARSIAVLGTGTGGRADLPGEHGFRFFPGFYQHVPDTMGRIPYGSGTVLDNLVSATRIMIARRDARKIVTPTHVPTSLADIRCVLETLLCTRIDVAPLELAHFLTRLMVLLTSCADRRFAQFEQQSWWEFAGAEHRSTGYRKFLAEGLTRTLVAARANEMSARTGGYILLQLLADMTKVGNRTDRILNGPTSDVWIRPWVSHLEKLGVHFRFDSRVTAIHCAGQRIKGITVRRPKHPKRRTDTYDFSADFYVCALPIEIMAPTFTTLGLDDRDGSRVIPKSMRGPGLVDGRMKRAEPRFEELGELQTRWMNGLQFYFRSDVPLEPGHTIYIDSEWALTSISQRQFWADVDFSAMGDGTVEGILSVDVSDWTTPGGEACGHKPAMQCSRKEIIREVWDQLQCHLNHGVLPDLADANVITAFLDPDIQWPNPKKPRHCVNLEPLLVNTAGSWDKRPEAVTRIENLFLAGDYVRTETDLATMEGANEAARRAVNGILDACGSWAPKCRLWKLRQPLALGLMRLLDGAMFERFPSSFDLTPR